MRDNGIMNSKIIDLNTNLMINMYVELFEKNLDEFEMSASVVNKIMRDELHYANIKIYEFEKIKCLYNQLIYSAKIKAINTLSKFNTNMLRIIYYNLAEHISEVHIYLYSKIYDIFGKQYSEYFPSASFREGVNSVNGSEVIKKINKSNIGKTSSLMGLDKYFIQYFFILLGEVNENYDREILMKKEEFYIIYKNIISIICLIEERDFLQNYFNELDYIEIIDGIITIPNFIKNKIKNDTENSIFYSILTNKEIDDKLFNKMQMNFFEKNKFFPSDLKTLFEQFIIDNHISQNKVSFIPKLDFVYLINNNLSKNNGDKIIEFLLYKKSEKRNIIETNINSYNYRLFKKPFVEIVIDDNTFIMFSPFILLYTYNILLKEMRYIDISYANPKLLKKMNNIIVENLENELKKCGIEHYSNIYLNNSNYEVDLLFVKNKCLYIIECKDIMPKFTNQDYKNDIRRLKKEYIPNINNKENIILANIDDYIKIFKTYFNSLQKIIVFKHFSHAKENLIGELDKYKIIILTESELFALIQN